MTVKHLYAAVQSKPSVLGFIVRSFVETLKNIRQIRQTAGEYCGMSAWRAHYEKPMSWFGPSL